MNLKAEVYNNGVLCGFLEKTDGGDFVFTYDDQYYNNPDTYPVSLTLPKASLVYRSPHLFPFFFGLLSEGVNKQTQCSLLKIDEEDHFRLLIKTAGTDTIGSVTVKEIES